MCQRPACPGIERFFATSITEFFRCCNISGAAPQSKAAANHSRNHLLVWHNEVRSTTSDQGIEEEQAGGTFECPLMPRKEYGCSLRPLRLSAYHAPSDLPLAEYPKKKALSGAQSCKQTAVLLFVEAVHSQAADQNRAPSHSDEIVHQIHHYLTRDFGPVYMLQETEKGSKYISQQTSSGRFSIYLPCPGVEQIDARRMESERLADWLQGLRITGKTLQHMQEATLFKRVHNTKVGTSSALQANPSPSRKVAILDAIS